MAFKMNRPLKMKGPLKRAGLNIGRAKNKPVDDGVFYNSKMGPMKMVSPSALKQIEEEAAMEEMMGMMGAGMEGGTEGGMEGEVATEAAPVEGKEEEPEKADFIYGQEIEVVGDGEYQIDIDDLGYGIGGIDQNEGVVEVLDPNGILGNVKEGDYVADNDFTFEVEDGKVIITGVGGGE